MSKLSSLIDLELRSQVPVPVLELFVALVVASTLFSYETATFNTTMGGVIDPSLVLGLTGAFSVSLLRDTLTSVFLLSVVGTIMLVSVSMGGSLGSGLAETLLSYPVGRFEYISSKIILFSVISSGPILLGVSIAMALSPFAYSLSQILLTVGIIASKSLLIVATSLIVATLVGRTIPAAMMTTFFWFFLFLFHSSFPTPYKYVLFSEDILVLRETWTGILWGIIGPLATSFAILAVVFVYFKNLNIVRGQV
jgi:hypothetical protein